MNIIKKNYHWIIVALILIEQAVHVGIINNISGLFIIPVTEDLGISRGSFSLAYSLRSLAGFFSTLFSGIFFAKYGYRKLCTVFLFVTAGAYALLGASQNGIMLAFALALSGAGEGFCSTAAATRMVNTWFYTHQGLILGLVTAATGLGGSLFSIVLSGSIEANGWRAGYYLCGILVAVMAVLIFLISRDRPGQMGLLPFGAGRHHGKKARKAHRDHWYGYEPQDVTKKPAFYLMLVVVFLSGTCCYSAFSAVVPHFQDCGMSATQAASMQSIMLLALAATKFLCGMLSDALGAKTVNALCLVCNVIALILLAFSHNELMALAAVLAFSVGLVMTTITAPLLSSALFGYHPQSNIIGIVMALIPASSVVTLPLVNAIYDRIGTYSPIFLAFAGVGIATLIIMFILFWVSDRDRKHFESVHPELMDMEESV